MRKYLDLPYDVQNKICKDTLRPMAAQIYGFIYQVEADRGNQWLDDTITIKRIAHEAVTAASAICAELNDMYGSQMDDPYRDDEIEEYEKYLHDQEHL